MTYPEQINLSFNFSSIKDDFQTSGPLEIDPSERGYWAIIQGNNLIVNSSLKLPEGALPDQMQPAEEPLCIGRWHGKPLRVFQLDKNSAITAPFRAEGFNATNDLLDIQTLTLGGIASQILHWDLQSRFCSRCGCPTKPHHSNWGRTCTGCHAEHFPHIHPCAIVLVRRGDQLLLTRKAQWPPNRYSLVAGFVDFGESLEECALREIKEETGITAENIRYIGSQNWPFPAQLMAGFVADYKSGEIKVDKNELEDARWFPTSQLPDLPGKRSIARWIIDNFGQ